MDKNLDLSVTSYAAKLIDCVCKSIRIPSICARAVSGFPYGSAIAKAADHAMTEARNLGFCVGNLNGLVAWAEYGNGDETVAVMGHLDVVPPGDGWDFDPYSGIVEKGYILGRGSQDDKGPLFSSLFALRAVADLGVPLKRKVRIIFGLDEETGKMRDVEAYLKSEGAPLMSFTPDGEYPIVNTEKGAIKFKASKKFTKINNSGLRLLKIKGGKTLGSVPASAYAILAGDRSILLSVSKIFKKQASLLSWEISCDILDETLKISVAGKAAHATLPSLGVNAAGRLLLLLSHANIPGEHGDYIAFLAEKIGVDTEGRQLAINAVHPHAGNLTLNLAIIDGEQDSITVQVGVYVPANTIPFETVCSSIERAFGRIGATIDIISKIPPLFVSEDHILIQKLKAGYYNATGEEPKLISMCGSTYSKKMPNMVPFGATFNGEDDRAHGANERVLISNLLESTRIMAYAILEMAR